MVPNVRLDRGSWAHAMRPATTGFRLASSIRKLDGVVIHGRDVVGVSEANGKVARPEVLVEKTAFRRGSLDKRNLVSVREHEPKLICHWMF